MVNSIQFLSFCICFLCCAQVVYVLVCPRYNLYLGQEKSIYISWLSVLSGVSGVSGVYLYGICMKNISGLRRYPGHPGGGH
jgi:hypothetical protein